MKKSTFVLLVVGMALLNAACALLQVTVAKQSLYDPASDHEQL